MANIKLTLDKRRQLEDGNYPLVFRITAEGKARDIATGFHSKENQFHHQSRQLRKNHPSYESINPRLQELEAEYLSRLIELERKSNKALGAQEIKQWMLSTNTAAKTVYSFWKEEIQLLQKAGRSGGARVYSQALSVLDKAVSLRISFDIVDIGFIKHLEAELLSRGLKVNSVGVYFRTFRAIYNRAIDEGLVGYQNYPFRRFKIKREATIPRPLTVEELRRYFTLNLPTDSTYYDSWLLGKLMFMLLGINFRDLITIRKSQVVNGRLIYSRSKTKRQYSIKLLAEAEEILRYFNDRSQVTLIGKLKDEELLKKETLPFKAHQANKVFNSHLDKLGKMINLNQKLTGYCFRYSVANIAKQLGYSKDLISEALGHSYGNRVTGIYLEAFDLGYIDKMNSAILNHINEAPTSIEENVFEEVLS